MAKKEKKKTEGFYNRRMDQKEHESKPIEHVPSEFQMNRNQFYNPRHGRAIDWNSE